MSTTARLAIGLVVLAALRVALAFGHSSAWWALDGYRFAPLGLALVLVALTALTLVASLGARAARPLSAFGDALARGDARAAGGGAAALALLVLLFPDRTLYVGDALLRNTVGVADLTYLGGPGQLLPLDQLLHVALPRLLEARGILYVAHTARILGAIEAATLALLAVAWVRVLGLKGVSAAVAWAITVGGGSLLLFAGYGKAPVELTLVAIAIAVLGVRLLRTGEGRAALGLVLAAALLLHRSALLFAPAGLVALVLAPRATSRRWWAAWLAALIVLVAMAPRVLGTFASYDVGQHLSPGDIGWAGGLFDRSTFALRALDLLNLALWLCPLLLLVPLVLGRDEGGDAGRGERAFAVAFLAPQVAMMVALLPRQGLPRDWDVFAAAGGALAAWTGVVLARAIARRPEAARLGAALIVAVAAPLLASFAIYASTERGLARVRALVEEPPVRGERVAATTWDFLASRYHDLRDPAAEAEAFRKSAESAPNPRVLVGWANAAERAGDRAEALEAYRLLAIRDSLSVLAWTEIARLSFQTGDTVATWHAVVHLRELDPADPNIQVSFAVLDSMRSAGLRRGTWKGD